MKIGFSTGSIALSDVKLGIRIATHPLTKAIELSALREEELDPLHESLDSLESELKHFEHISFHAPSKRVQFSEVELIERLRKVTNRGWGIIIHPDVIENFSLWQGLGEAICIENMDKRKKIGRSAEQLEQIFAKLPLARLCFDIGHAHQVDPTMQEAFTILRNFQDRMHQVHMSFVNSVSNHERLNFLSIRSFQRVAHWIDKSIPIILETPIKPEEIEAEINSAKEVFSLSF